MAIKIITGELGYLLEVDGIESDPHRYGHAIISGGPSGALYGAMMTEPDSKPQVYKLTPVDSVHEDVDLDVDTEGGYVEDGLYDDGGGEGDDEGEGEDEDEDEDDSTTTTISV